mgnify:CR=1 FL=1
MKVIADEDMYIASTWGAAIRLYKGEVKEVGDDFGLLALQQGARRIEDSPLRNPSLLARDFTSEGLPKQSVIKTVFGEQISADERDEVWAEMIVDREED